MIIRIDPATAPAVAEQVYAQIVAAIVDGNLPPATLLPTIRSLARDLDIAPGTVARSYADLEREGWVVTSGRRGTAVAPQPGGRPRAEVTAAATVLARAVRAARLDDAEAHRAINVAFARLATEA